MAEKLMSAENRKDGKQVIDLEWPKEMGEYSHVKRAPKEGAPGSRWDPMLQRFGPGGGGRGLRGPQIL